MRLDEALRETGKARRPASRPGYHVRRHNEELFLYCDDKRGDPYNFVEGFETDWLPYHDPPKEKRLREYGIGSTRVTGRYSPHLMAWELPGGDDIIVREISPERDAIVDNVAEYFLRFGPYESKNLKFLFESYEAWKAAGSPR